MDKTIMGRKTQIKRNLAITGFMSIAICAVLLPTALASKTTTAAETAAANLTLPVSSRIDKPQNINTPLNAEKLNKRLLDIALTYPINAEHYHHLVRQMSLLNKNASQREASVDTLQKMLSIAKKNNKAKLIPLLQNDLGKAKVDIGDFENARLDFNAALFNLAKDANSDLRLRISLNAINTAISSQYTKGLKQQFSAVTQAINALPENKQRAEFTSSLATFMHNAQKQLGLNEDFRLQAFQLFNDVIKQSKKLNDPRLLSYALGSIGKLYEDEKRFAEALSYTRRAVFQAQEINASELEYRWGWQLGRLLHVQQRNDEALIAYQLTLRALKKVRHQLMISHYDSFKQSIVPIYNQYFSLFVNVIERTNDEVQKQELLTQLLNSIEQFAISEIENYFQSACFEEDDIRDTNTIDDNATIAVYPLILAERIVLLVKHQDKLALFTKAAKREQIIKTVNAYRESISNYKFNAEFRELSIRLYDQLIRPMETEISKANTLIFIPLGILRTLPMAALFDGEQYLIEKYAVVTTPSLQLTNTQAYPIKKRKVLVNGLSHAVQGYDALPSVNKEIENIASMYDAVVLKNENFTVDRISEEITEGRYDVVHIATHGEFNSDFRKSYLLGHNRKLTINNLEKIMLTRRYQNSPLDLLVLSACQTATGDERAALGLAGVAVKAGVRSAVATLWFISDAATAQLIAEFYHQLKQPGVTKAQALQQAQLKLIKTKRYKHPNFWAPFILIGNWL